MILISVRNCRYLKYRLFISFMLFVYLSLTFQLLFILVPAPGQQHLQNQKQHNLNQGRFGVKNKKKLEQIEDDLKCQVYTKEREMMIGRPFEFVVTCQSPLVKTEGLRLGIVTQMQNTLQKEQESSCRITSENEYCRLMFTPKQSGKYQVRILHLKLYEGAAAALAIGNSSNAQATVVHERQYPVLGLCASSEAGVWTISPKNVVKWAPKTCRLPRPSQNAIRKNANALIFMGNSHIRNLFRCVADTLTSGRSWKQSMRLTGKVCDFQDVRSACLSCNNTSKTHGEDFGMKYGTLRAQFYWTVAWNVSAESRRACNNTSSSSNSIEQVKCQLSHEYESRRSYTGSRIGLDFMQTNLTRRFEHDPHLKLVFNYCHMYNNDWTARDLAEILSRPPFQGRSYLVVDATSKKKDFDSILEIFRQSGVRIIDMRSVYSTFPTEALPKDLPYTSDNHLYGPLQKLLVRVILSHLSSSSPS